MTGRDIGYQIEFDSAHKMLKLRLWGMWDIEQARRFEQEVKPKILQVGRQAPQGWFTVVDLRRFPAQFPEVQEMTRGIMRFEVAHGMKKGATVMAKTMTKLQMQRLAKQEGFAPGSFFQSEDEAIRWLLSDE